MPTPGKGAQLGTRWGAKLKRAPLVEPEKGLVERYIFGTTDTPTSKIWTGTEWLELQPPTTITRSTTFQQNVSIQGRVGFYGTTPIAKPSSYTQTYSTADKTLSAYTPDIENVAYTGAADGEAKLADINALRVAVENLRVFAEDIAGVVNSHTDDLQALGLVG